MKNKDKSLLKLAKRNKEVSSTKKKENIIVNPITPEEERDLKAKETVNELLKDVNLNLDKNNEIINTSSNIGTKENKSGVEWLEEQVALLSEENERLHNEAIQAKDDYRKIFDDYQRIKNKGSVILNENNDDNIIKSTVIKLFNEIQANYFNMGMNQRTGQPNLILPPVAFMNRMIMFFPFLIDEKKF
jgi:uncharacterized small protein (DUF1192 family)